MWKCKRKSMKEPGNTWQKRIFDQAEICFTDVCGSPSHHVCVSSWTGTLWIITHTLLNLGFFRIKGTTTASLSVVSSSPLPMQSVAMVTSASLFFLPSLWRHFGDLHFCSYKLFIGIVLLIHHPRLVRHAAQPSTLHLPHLHLYLRLTAERSTVWELIRDVQGSNAPPGWSVWAFL